MGISGGINFYHSVKNLQLKDVLLFSRDISKEINPHISVDCNWVAYDVGRSRGDYVRKLVDVLSVFSRIGFIVHPIVDGDVRHHSKQVSVGKRALEKQIAQINVKKKRLKALALTAKLNSSKNNLSMQEQKQIENERKLMEKSLKVAKKMISAPFPKSFYSDLVDELSATNLLLVNEVGGQVIHPVKARFQADSLIVQKIINGESTLCIANDTDYGFMGGSKIVQVSSFKLRGLI